MFLILSAAWFKVYRPKCFKFSYVSFPGSEESYKLTKTLQIPHKSDGTRRNHTENPKSEKIDRLCSLPGSSIYNFTKLNWNTYGPQLWQFIIKPLTFRSIWTNNLLPVIAFPEGQAIKFRWPLSIDKSKWCSTSSAILTDNFAIFINQSVFIACWRISLCVVMITACLSNEQRTHSKDVEQRPQDPVEPKFLAGSQNLVNCRTVS